MVAVEVDYEQRPDGSWVIGGEHACSSARPVVTIFRATTSDEGDLTREQARELEAVAEARRREVLHWIGQLMGDLMRVQYSSPERASTTSDAMGIAAARSALRRLMTPSLMPLMARELAATYDRLRLTLAATLAEAEGPKAARRMPATCPYTLERILDHHWYPQALRKPYR